MVDSKSGTLISKLDIPLKLIKAILTVFLLVLMEDIWPPEEEIKIYIFGIFKIYQANPDKVKPKAQLIKSLLTPNYNGLLLLLMLVSRSGI